MDGEKGGKLHWNSTGAKKEPFSKGRNVCKKEDSQSVFPFLFLSQFPSFISLFEFGTLLSSNERESKLKARKRYFSFSVGPIWDFVVLYIEKKKKKKGQQLQQIQPESERERRKDDLRF